MKSKSTASVQHLRDFFFRARPKSQQRLVRATHPTACEPLEARRLFAVIPVSGTISANVTWEAAHSYRLDGNVTVAPGVILTIEPTTRVFSDVDRTLTIATSTNLATLNAENVNFDNKVSLVLNREARGFLRNSTFGTSAAISIEPSFSPNFVLQGNQLPATVRAHPEAVPYLTSNTLSGNVVQVFGFRDLDKDITWPVLGSVNTYQIFNDGTTSNSNADVEINPGGTLRIADGVNITTNASGLSGIDVNSGGALLATNAASGVAAPITFLAGSGGEIRNTTLSDIVVVREPNRNLTFTGNIFTARLDLDTPRTPLITFTGNTLNGGVRAHPEAVPYLTSNTLSGNVVQVFGFRDLDKDITWPVLGSVNTYQIFNDGTTSNSNADVEINPGGTLRIADGVNITTNASGLSGIDVNSGGALLATNAASGVAAPITFLAGSGGEIRNTTLSDIVVVREPNRNLTFTGNIFTARLDLDTPRTPLITFTGNTLNGGVRAHPEAVPYLTSNTLSGNVVQVFGFRDLDKDITWPVLGSVNTYQIFNDGTTSNSNADVEINPGGTLRIADGVNITTNASGLSGIDVNSGGALLATNAASGVAAPITFLAGSGGEIRNTTLSDIVVVRETTNNLTFTGNIFTAGLDLDTPRTPLITFTGNTLNGGVRAHPEAVPYLTSNTLSGNVVQVFGFRDLDKDITWPVLGSVNTYQIFNDGTTSNSNADVEINPGGTLRIADGVNITTNASGLSGIDVNSGGALLATNAASGVAAPITFLAGSGGEIRNTTLSDIVVVREPNRNLTFTGNIFTARLDLDTPRTPLITFTGNTLNGGVRAHPEAVPYLTSNTLSGNVVQVFGFRDLDKDITWPVLGSVNTYQIFNDGTTSNSNADVEINPGGTLRIADGVNITTNASGLSGIDVNSGGALLAIYNAILQVPILADSGSAGQIRYSTIATPERITIHSGSTLKVTNSSVRFVTSTGSPTARIVLENNWWGTTNPSDIASLIVDNADDNRLPRIDFDPPLGSAAEINPTGLVAYLTYGDAPLINGDESISELIGTDFGTSFRGEASVTRTFTLKNIGTANLTVSSISGSGVFSVPDNVNGAIAPGDFRSFTVHMSTSSTPGTKTGTISIATNGSDPSPFSFKVEGKISNVSAQFVQQFTTRPASSTPVGSFVVKLVDDDDNHITQALVEYPSARLILESTNGNTFIDSWLSSYSNGQYSFVVPALTMAGQFRFRVVATSGASIGASTSTPFTINAGPATEIRFTNFTPSAPIKAGVSLGSIRVAVTDEFGNAIGGSGTATISLIPQNGALGTLAGTLSKPISNSTATFTGLSVDRPGIYRLRVTASGPGLAFRESDVFTVVPGDATHVQFVTPLQATLTAGAILPTFSVVLRDSSGNVAANDSSTVVTVQETGPGDFSGGEINRTVVNGTATFSGLTLTRAASYDVSVRIVSNGATSPPANLIVSPAAPTTVALTGSLATTTPGNPNSTTLSAVVRDRFENTVTSAGSTVVTLSLLGSGGAVLLGGNAGNITATTVAGVASFSGLRVSAPGTYALAASATGLAGSTSLEFTIQAAVASSAVFITNATDGNADNPLSPITLALNDQFGFPMPGGQQVVAGLVDGGNSLGTATSTNGTVSFANLRITRAAQAHRISFSANGKLLATSASFRVTAGAPDRLQLGPISDLPAGNGIAPFSVITTDRFGNAAGIPITSLTLTTKRSEDNAVEPLAATVTPGDAGVTVTAAPITRAGTYTLTASAVGLNSATSLPFRVTGGVADSITISNVSINRARAGGPGPTVSVAIRDRFGNLANADGQTARLVRTDNTVVEAVVSGGIATFQLGAETVAASYRFAAFLGALSSPAETVYEVTAADPVALRFEASSYGTTVNNRVRSVVVSVRDVYGNLVRENSGPITLRNTSGNVSTVTAVNGQATFQDVPIGTTVSSQTLEAVSGELPTATTQARVELPVRAGVGLTNQTLTAVAGARIPAVGIVSLDQFDFPISANAKGLRFTLSVSGPNGFNRTITARLQRGGTISATLPTLRVAGTYSLVARQSTLQSSVGSLVVSPGAPAALAFAVAPPRSTPANSPFGATVRVVDRFNNLVPLNDGIVSLRLSARQTTNFSSVPLVDGSATFADLSLQKGKYTLFFSVPGIKKALSSRPITVG